MRSSLAIVGSVLAAACWADAAILYAPLQRGADQRLFCEAFNIGHKPRDVTIEITDIIGTVSVTEVCEGLPPNASCQAIQGPTGFQASLCRFTFKGGKNSVKATAAVGDVQGNKAATLPAW